MSISVLILTHNDQSTLASCLESVSWSDDIVILDSASDDRTVEIAREYGAHVMACECDGNTVEAAGKMKFKYPWVYIPHADEITPPRLRDEMLEAVMDPKCDVVGYRARSRLIFFGKWVKHSSRYPNWELRLFRTDRAAGDREGRLKTPLDHHEFAKGLPAWWEAQNDATSQAARDLLPMLQPEKPDWSGLFSQSNVRRRAAIIDFSFRIPFRSFWIFLYMLIVRRGFLDGPAGWTYCRMRAYYHFLVAAKIRELQRLARGEAPG